jgi:hypothetical protein
MTEENTEQLDQEALIQRSYDYGRTKWDALASIYNSNPLRLILVVAAILVGNWYFGSPLHLGAVFVGFILIGIASWVLFPHAPWAWILRLDLANRRIIPYTVKVEDAMIALDEMGAKRNFDDGTGRSVIVEGDYLPISEVHVISELDYLADISTIYKALGLLPDIMLEYMMLKKARGIDVSLLAERGVDLQNRVKDPMTSDQILALLGEFLHEHDDRTEEKRDTDQ